MTTRRKEAVEIAQKCHMFGLIQGSLGRQGNPRIVEVYFLDIYIYIYIYVRQKWKKDLFNLVLGFGEETAGGWKKVYTRSYLRNNAPKVIFFH